MRSIKYIYRTGDLIKDKFDAEYLIVDIHPKNSKTPFSYRLKRILNGCLDSPFWIPSTRVYKFYSPCSSIIKVLFSDQGSEATKTLDQRLSE